ncbi:MAG TPA: DUF6544 family protein [candidate division Zixibacteria bacterium]|nr:DUF6544 family protein [candidate division Zixibacteria bacterium]
MPDPTNRLPPGAERYLVHAIGPGAAPPRSVEVEFHGRLRLGPDRSWMRFTARETIRVGDSFEFVARARGGPLVVTTQDRYLDGRGESQVRLFGLIPVATRRGPDQDRAMRARLVVESVWLPSTFLPANGAKWEAADGGLRVSVPVHGEDVSAAMDIGADGGLRAMRVERWSDLTFDGSWAMVPFESRVAAERRFGACTIPSRLAATWWAGTDRAFTFFEATVDDARFST